MKNRIRNKGHKDSRQNVILIVIILLIGIWAIPTCSGIMMKEHTHNKDIFFSTVSTINGNILHVGGSGPGNYSKIQGAVDDASNGDTIYVHAGVYYEHITVNKTIILLGEKRETTIIDGDGIGDVVSVYADGVNISGFTVQNSGDSFPEAGMEFHSDNNAIIGNIISHNGEFGVGIFLNGSSHNEICDNRIYKNGNEGIYLEGSAYNLIQNNEIFINGHCAVVISHSSYNTVVDNDMYDNHATMSLWTGATHNEIARNTMHGHPWSGMGIHEDANYNSIHHNNFYNNPQYGITLLDTKGNVINHNTISGSSKGIVLSSSSFTVIRHNNFIENDCDALFDNSSRNLWIRNHWDDHISLLPKCIRGEICLPWNKSVIIPWINFDWFPARTPYKIYGGRA